MKEFGLFKNLFGAALRAPGNFIVMGSLLLMAAGMSGCLDPVGKADDGIISTIDKKFILPPIVSPASAVTPITASIVANGIATVSVTVTLVDYNTALPISGKTVTLTSNRAALLDTISAASGQSDANGVVTFSVTSITPGTAIFTVNDTTDTIPLVSFITVAWASGVVNHIAFTTQPSATGNTDTALAQQPIVTGYDVNNNPVINVVNTITLATYSDAACTALVASGVSASTNPVALSPLGVATFSGVKGLKTNVIRIGATSTTGAFKACSNAIVVSPGVTKSLTVSNFTTPATAGTSYMFHVTALDANGNITPAYVGTVAFTSSDGAAVLPGNNTFTTGAGGDNGFNNGFIGTLKTVGGGTQTLTATDTITGTITGFQTITVSPAPTVAYTVSGFPVSPATTQAGQSYNVTVTAIDAFGNTTPAYSNATAVTLTSTDANALLAAPSGLTSGTHVFAVTLYKNGAETVTATGSDAKTGSQSTISVTGGTPSATKSTLALVPATVVNDGATTSSVTATMINSAGYPVPGQAVTLTSSRNGTDTIATVSGTTDATGKATFTVKSSTIGNPILTATDTASITGKLLFLSQTPSVDFQAQYAKSGISAGDTTVNTWWKDLFQTSTANDFNLHGFPGTNTAWSGTGGIGNPAAPYQLLFTPASTQYLQSTTTLNSTNGFYFETWANPSSVTTLGSVILNTADANHGFQLKQSSSSSPAIRRVRLNSS